jgi:fructokinase
VAFHATQLGLRGVVCSRVGADAWGAELLDFLEAHGLDTDAIQRDPKHLTGKVTVHLDAQHGPSYTIHAPAAWDFLGFDAAWREVMRSAAAVCFGTLAQRAPDSREAIGRCLDAAPQALRVYDINLRPPHFERAWIEASLRRAQVVKLNDEECGLLDGLLGIHAGSEEGFCRALLAEYGVGRVFLTRGSAGCLAVSATESIAVPGVAVEVADTVGAGDAFTAALILGLLEEWPLADTARFANRVGGLVASYPGAMPEVREAMAALRADVLGGA